MVTREKEGARQRILDAAVRRIAQEGIDGVRIARIAMDAGVSAALVHYHFDSRDALLAEAIDHSYELVGNVRIGETEGAGAADRLRLMIEGSLPLPGDQTDDWLLWIELWLRAARRPELRATAAQLYARYHEWFATVIQEGVDSGELRCADVAETADLALALIDGLGVRALTGDPTMDVARARERIWAELAPRIGLS